MRRTRSPLANSASIGLGCLLTASLLARDYPVAMGVLMLLAVAVVVTNLLTDLAYGWIDPRVRVAG